MCIIKVGDMMKRHKVILFQLFLLAISVIISINFFSKTTSTEILLDLAEKTKNPTRIVAVVDGVEIYQENIDFMLKANEVSKENSAQQIFDNDILQNETVNKDAVLNNRIRSIVIYNEAKRLGLEADYEEAYQIAKNAYDATKAQNDENYALIVDYMKKLKFSEDEYMELITETYQNLMTQSNLYSNFIKDKTGTDEEFNEMFELYVEDLIKKAKIEYK